MTEAVDLAARLRQLVFNAESKDSKSDEAEVRKQHTNIAVLWYGDS